MKGLSKILLATSALAFLLVPELCTACTRVVSHRKVNNSFVVFVQDPTGTPLSGYQVTAYIFISKPPHSEVAASGITGQDGKVPFHLTDNYSISAIHAGVSSEVALIDVYEDGSGASELKLIWPGGPITQIQNASGQLGLGKEKSPWVGASVELKAATSDKSIGKFTTDAEGRFSFSGISPGFYALQLKDATFIPSRAPQLEGYVPIEVRKDAPNAELPTWGFVASDCGLSAYTDGRSMISFSP